MDKNYICVRFVLDLNQLDKSWTVTQKSVLTQNLTKLKAWGQPTDRVSVLRLLLCRHHRGSSDARAPELDFQEWKFLGICMHLCTYYTHTSIACENIYSCNYYRHLIYSDFLFTKQFKCSVLECWTRQQQMMVNWVYVYHLNVAFLIMFNLSFHHYHSDWNQRQLSCCV